MEFVTLKRALIAIAVAVAFLVPTRSIIGMYRSDQARATAAPNCRQYLDRAIEAVEARGTTYGADTYYATRAIAWAKIAEVCTKF